MTSVHLDSTSPLGVSEREESPQLLQWLRNVSLVLRCLVALQLSGAIVHVTQTSWPAF